MCRSASSFIRVPAAKSATSLPAAVQHDDKRYRLADIATGNVEGEGARPCRLTMSQVSGLADRLSVPPDSPWCLSRVDPTRGWPSCQDLPASPGRPAATHDKGVTTDSA